MRRTITVPADYDAPRTFGFLQMKAARGSMVRDGPTTVWASLTPAGAVTLQFVSRPGELVVTAWGEGAPWALDRARAFAGLDDRVGEFDPPPGLIHELHRRFGGMRLGATGIVWDTLVQAILGQRVTGREARVSYRRLQDRFGDTAPGPHDLRTPPRPERIAELSWHDLHPSGVERSRAGTLIESARRINRLQEAMEMARQDAWVRLQSITGIGPWTAAAVMGVARGDSDAVQVGDYHLPDMVAWALAGEPRADDKRMLELLEPYRGHRRRTVLLIKSAGISAPRFGPRQAIQPIANR